MMMRVCVIVAACALQSVGVSVQNAVPEVRKALEEGNAAAHKADKAAYSRFLADDLRWVRDDGGIDGKQERLNGLTGKNVPKISDIDARVVGDVAIVTATHTATNGNKARPVRWSGGMADGSWFFTPKRR